ncbi:hypothetical protein TAO_0140 [Candidatus Nitrosoglobus terrae]|uniref:Uncharacterized protein n=1 Tax=Candidatus Nitrosoglobus terrae TaxID=1630141 RepID=A0A1Q2SK69_9GAMM|nr:hypothetical protein [Candidatus Nitrosoglobus terrae]BAW79510.1 hypothetical protein TAO_0140 [Candidatus Nitrosoglobus terrae]
MANFFSLKGKDLDITYRIGGNPSFISLIYKTPNTREVFRPTQIEKVKTPLGSMITVLISTIEPLAEKAANVAEQSDWDDWGRTFSVFLPDICVPLDKSVKFNTIGVYKNVGGPITTSGPEVHWSCIDLEGTAQTVLVLC